MKEWLYSLQSRIQHMTHAQALVCVAVYACIFSLPLFTQQILIAQDIFNAIARVNAVVTHFGDGQWYVRWVPVMEHGFGYPLFNYYPPLFSYIAAPGVFIFGMLGSIYATSAFLWILSAVCMYEWVRLELGHRPAFIASLFYTLAPYHVINIYSRGALSEFTAMTFLPLCFLACAYGLRKYTFFGYAAIAISVAALVLAHNSTALISLPCLVAYGIFLVVQKTRQSTNVSSVRATLLCITLYKRILFFIGALGTGLLTSMFYWLPALVEKSAVHLEDVTKGFYHYTRHFETVGSMFGVTSHNGDGIGLPIGRLYFVLLIYVIARIVLAQRKKVWRDRSVGLFWCSIMVVYMFLALSISDPIYHLFPILQTIQFPWRVFSVASVVISFLLAYTRTFSGASQKTSAVFFVSMLGFALVFILYMAAATSLFFMSESSDAFFVRKSLQVDYTYELATASGIFGVIAEYTPSGVRTDLPRDVMPGGIIALKHPEQVNIKQHRLVSDVEHLYTLQLQEQDRLRFGGLYFPGWKVEVDGIHTPIIVGDTGAIDVDVSAGSHSVRVYFTDTPVRAWSNAVSICTSAFLALCAAWFLFVRYTRPQNR